MRKINLILPIVAGIVLSSIPALADPITGILSVSGGDVYSNSLDTINFDATGNSVGGTSTGSLGAFTSGNAVTANDFSFGTGFVSGTEIFSTTENGITTTFTLLNETSNIDASGLLIAGMGTLTETGYSDTAASFSLTTQNGGHDINDVTYSMTTIPTSATPEPSSLVMLGSGLLGFAGFMRRKLAL